MEGATPSRPGRAPPICREGREAPEPLLAIRGPQCALNPPPDPICVRNVKIATKAK